MYKFTCFVVCGLVVISTNVYAVTEEERAAFQTAFKPILLECSESHGVSDDDIKKATAASSAEGINPCFIGCVLKKSGVLNSQGLYDLDKGMSTLKTYIKNDEDVSKFEDVGQKCLSVNDQTVSDGEEGCERGKLLLTCFLQHNANIPL